MGRGSSGAIAILVAASLSAGCGRVRYEHLEVDAGTDAGRACPPPPVSLADVRCDALDGCPPPAICDGLALLLHFDIDGTAGETVARAHDYSGRGNVARCTDCPLPDPAGAFGGAYSFGGTTHFLVPNDPTLAAPNAVTMSAWFFPRTHSTDWAPIMTKFRPDPERANYRLADNGAAFHVNFRPDGLDWLNHGTATDYPEGRWYHVVGVIENEGHVVRVYVDGALALDTTAVADMDTGDGDVYIGYAPNELGVDGLVDDVAVWTRRLTEVEIASLYP